MAFPDNILRILQGMNTFGIPQQEPNLGNSVGLPPGAMNIQEDPVFSPKTEAQDRLKVSLDQMPTRNTPGIWRKLGAGLVGMGSGPQAAEHFKYAPYYHQLEDWKNQIEPLGDLARIENQENTQNRMIWNTNQINQRAGDTLDFKREQEQRRLAKDQADFEIKSKRLELDQELANGGRAISDRDGNMFIVNKKGEVKDIDKTTLSMADRMRLAQEGRMIIVNDQQEAARELAKMKAEFDAENIRLRGEVSKDVAAAKASSPDQMTPNEIKTQQYIKAQEWFNKHPEAKNYITLGDPGSNTFSIKEPSTSGLAEWWSGGGLGETRRKEYKDALDFIYGEDKKTPTNTPPRGNINSAPTGRPAPVAQAPTGLPPIEQRKDGMEFTWPNGNVGRWNKKEQKWEIVKLVKR